MRGLRTQESAKFVAFFEIVQNLASKHRKVFFLDSGLGREVAGAEYEGENMQGWLISMEKADEFEKQFLAFKNGEEWDDFFAFLDWEKVNGDVKIFFEEYDDNDIPKILN